MKRYYSESDSEGDVKSYGSSGDPQAQARKKRRGVIEKRRRDRINNSLSELRRLVPSASEKQGCSKLEKAEILQLTVEHLKSLHDNSMFLPQTALDSRATGFRECAAEVVRYLVTVEGLPAHEPLTQRLLSHLHNNLSQREKTEEYNAQQWTSINHFASQAFPNFVPATHLQKGGRHLPPGLAHITHPPRAPDLYRGTLSAQAPLAAFAAAFPFLSPAHYSPFGGLISPGSRLLSSANNMNRGITTTMKVQKPL